MSIVMDVLPLREWAALNDNKDAIALTPDILRTMRLVAEQNYRIHYSFTDCPDYSNVLLSCIATRKDIVREHPAFVQAIVKAIQLAVFKIQARHPEVIRYAESAWQDNQEYVIPALDMALKDASFPKNIEITRAQWLKAAEVSHFSHGAKLDRHVADLTFDNAVLPFINFAVTAAIEIHDAGVKAELDKVSNDHARGSRWKRWWAENSAEAIAWMIAALTIPILPLMQPIAAFQHIPTIAFIITTIFFLMRKKTKWFYSSLAASALWIAQVEILPDHVTFISVALGVLVGVIPPVVSFEPPKASDD